VIAKSTHTDITGGKDSLKKDILEIFKDKKSLPRRCGLYGKDPDNDDPGTGYVDVDMEQIELDEDLRRKYGEKVTARIDIDIAESKAAAAAHNAGVVPKAYAEWLKTDEGKAASEDMKAVVFEAIRQGKLSADGHYTEQISRNLIGSPDGSPLPSGLTYLSLGGGGGGGVLFSGKGNKGNPGGNPGGQGNPPGGQKSPEEAAQEYFDKFQKWPTWWDPVNKKVV
jgi:hypothetical protein